MMEFTTVINERRSAKDFEPNVPISTEQLEVMVEEAQLAPTAFNLQHAKYIIVRDETVKQELKEVSLMQEKITNASAVIIITGDAQAYENVAEIYAHTLTGDVLTMKEEVIRDFYVPRGESFAREEAIRNGSLVAMQFMLVAKSYGWDTCPMIGFDKIEVRRILDIPANEEIVMMITLGKAVPMDEYSRGYRKPAQEVIRYK
ncbi:nitroreductase family protein [Metalysinibacillus jejuensis]|uniref:nitroreductase family protein n=1 Tax=Metalysinibacillus jejuensis TaxID=914327 RepID=UPI003D037368